MYILRTLHGESESVKLLYCYSLSWDFLQAVDMRRNIFRFLFLITVITTIENG